jgi:hypothetical protein
MQMVIDALRRSDGLATTDELLSRGIDRGMIDIALMYGRIRRVRKGLWGVLELPPAVVASQRAKGRLACVSALVHHELIDEAEFGLHVSAPLGQVSRHPLAPRHGVVRHGSRAPLDGDRFAVSENVAWAQFALCREVAGRDVQLRRPDSL